MHVYALWVSDALQGEKRAPDPLEQELQTIVSSGCCEPNLGPLEESLSIAHEHIFTN